MRAASCSGFSAITSWMVEQLGLATIPRWAWAEAPLTSGTTSGTSGCIRKALDLSTTTQPRLTASGANRSDVPPPAEKRARSKPASESSVSSRTSSSPPANGTRLPAERAEANGTTSEAGKPRWARIESTSGPTAPVAPTTASRRSDTDLPPLRLGQLLLELAVQGRHRLLDLLAGDHARHLDRRRGDHAHVDAVLGQDLEHAGGDTGMALHSGSDQAHLPGGRVGPPVQAELRAQLLDGVGHQRQLVGRDREGDVGVSVRDSVLDDRVDVDVRRRHRVEDAGSGTRLVGHVGQRHVGLVHRVRDA